METKNRSISKNIGSNIKKFRELKEITRERIASELNMSLSGYSKIERNEVDLTISRVERIAEILEVDLSQLLNFDATQIFNISNNQLVQGFGTTVENHNHSDEYREKYIKKLEEEVEGLKAIFRQSEISNLSSKDYFFDNLVRESLEKQNDKKK